MDAMKNFFVSDQAKRLQGDEILKVENLKVSFKIKDGILQAVRGVSLTVRRGQIVGIVGESGSGKSVCVKSLIGFNDGASTEADVLNLCDIDLQQLRKKAWTFVRGSYVSYIPQDPLMSLNPTKRIGAQVAEAIVVSERRKYAQQMKTLGEKASPADRREYRETKKALLAQARRERAALRAALDRSDPEYAKKAKAANAAYAQGKRKAIEQACRFDRAKAIRHAYEQAVRPEAVKKRVIDILTFIGIKDPKNRLQSYPHEFSGGMRQRIVIAIAVATKPDLIIADEPTTALDVTIQAKVLDLVKRLRDEFNITIIFISHNIALVANFCDYVYVMYAGKILEQGRTEELFLDPRHPYTWALIASIPDENAKNEKLVAIPGTPPNLISPPKGDAFASRNRFAMKVDFEAEPPLFEITPTHKAATWLLHPNAPKIDVPEEVRAKIEQSRASFKIYVEQKRTEEIRRAGTAEQRKQATEAQNDGR